MAKRIFYTNQCHRTGEWFVERIGAGEEAPCGWGPTKESAIEMLLRKEVLGVRAPNARPALHRA